MVLCSGGVLTIFAFGFLAVPCQGQDLAIPDTLSIIATNDTLLGPQRFPFAEVQVYHFHDSALLGFTIPLLWSGPVVLDSVSFSGTLTERYFQARWFEVDPSNHKVLVAAVGLGGVLMPTARGLLAKLYFTILGNGGLTIDSTRWGATVTLRFYSHIYLWAPVFNERIFVTRMTPPPGDVSFDSLVDMVDIVMVINHVFVQEGLQRHLRPAADVNSDCLVDIVDIFQLITYCYFGIGLLEQGCVL